MFNGHLFFFNSFCMSSRSIPAWYFCSIAASSSSEKQAKPSDMAFLYYWKIYYTIVNVLNKYTRKCHCEQIETIYTLEIASGFRPRNDYLLLPFIICYCLWKKHSLLCAVMLHWSERSEPLMVLWGTKRYRWLQVPVERSGVFTGRLRKTFRMTKRSGVSGWICFSIRTYL